MKASSDLLWFAVAVLTVTACGSTTGSPGSGEDGAPGGARSSDDPTPSGGAPAVDQQGDTGGRSSSGGSSATGGRENPGSGSSPSLGECEEDATRTRCQASQVPFGESCQCEEQVRSCQDGVWGPWNGSFEAQSCQVEPPADCGGVAHGTAEERVRYSTESVPFGSACSTASEVQTRSCSDGSWTTWSGTFVHDSCDEAPPAGCGASEHGNTLDRIRYQARVVPMGAFCQAEKQTTTCLNGNWSPWTGTYTEETCYREDERPCGDTRDGGIETRVRFRHEHVPSGSTCTQQTQSRRCNDSEWGEWSGSYAALSCSVENGASCDGEAHGSVQTRKRYAAAKVITGESCSSERQSRVCENGSWTSWTGTFSATTCQVVEPAPCDGLAHGTVQSRVRFEDDAPRIGDACEEETQFRSCFAGAWTVWTGSFTQTSCTAPVDPFSGVGRVCEFDSDCASGLVCGKDAISFESYAQCTAACTNQVSCTGLFGSSTLCGAGGSCLAECSQDSDCPSGTSCSSEGWCHRTGPGSGNPYCTGTAEPCDFLRQDQCGTRPECAWENRFESRCLRSGSANCVDAAQESHCYNAGPDCEWSHFTGCSSNRTEACTTMDSTTCGELRECHWGVGYLCAGEVPECGDIPVSFCAHQAGCSVHPAD